MDSTPAVRPREQRYLTGMVGYEKLVFEFLKSLFYNLI